MAAKLRHCSVRFRDYSIRIEEAKLAPTNNSVMRWYNNINWWYDSRGASKNSEFMKATVNHYSEHRPDILNFKS